MKSGIDITSILKKDEEDLQERDIEHDGMEENTRNSSNSIKSLEKSIEEIENKKSNEIESIADEQNALVKELEASSKGKVKGSLIVNYLNSAKRPFTLVFILVTLLLAQALASLADIWVSYW